MKLNCPNCGSSISAENVNIQDKMAVCSECDHVFRFGDDVPTRKSSQRKVRQPDRLHVHEEDDRLEMSYRRVFDPNEKIGLVVVTALAAFLMVITAVGFCDPEAPLFAPLLFGFIAAVFWYVAAMALVNNTYITIDEETVAAKTGPLPFPIKDDKTLSVREVTEIFCEETEASKSRAALDRYYRVCARFADGNRVALVKSLPQDFAFYITQELDARLPPEEDADVLVPGDEFYSSADREDVAAESVTHEPTDRASDRASG